MIQLEPRERNRADPKKAHPPSLSLLRHLEAAAAAAAA